MKIKLYYTPRTRALRVRWLLEELQLPYDLHHIDLFAGEANTEAFKKIHPLGCIPAIEIDNQIMFESAAICEWLADQFTENELSPQVNTKERMHFNQWMYFVTATLEPYAWNQVLHGHILPEQQRIPEIVPWSQTKYTEALDIIENQVVNKSFICGETFCIADIILASILSWLPKQLKNHPHTYNYMKQQLRREAYKAAIKD